VILTNSVSDHKVNFKVTNHARVTNILSKNGVYIDDADTSRNMQKIRRTLKMPILNSFSQILE